MEDIPIPGLPATECADSRSDWLTEVSLFANSSQRISMRTLTRGIPIEKNVYRTKKYLGGDFLLDGNE